MFDYELLRLIWWLLLGVLLIGFAIMDGFDLGIGMLLPFVARSNSERRIVLNSIGPVWEGNQIWLILGGGAIFAAWPMVYGLAFSGFFFAMLLVLLALIIRPLGFKYRSKINHPRWRQFWDGGLFIAGLIPTLLFGVAIGNVIQGVPFYFDSSLRAFYTGSLWDLLNPFGLWCGLVSVTMLLMHGGNFLTIKTQGAIQRRARNAVRFSAFAYIVLFAAAGYWLATQILGYLVVTPVVMDGPSNPLYKHVVLQKGAWLLNYQHFPWMMAAPSFGFLGALLAMLFTTLRCNKTAWLASSLSVLGTIATVGLSMFPFILPSSSHPDMSLLLWDSSSSQLTLLIMLIATLIFMPIIVAYTSWVYYVMRGPVTASDIEENDRQAY